MLFGVRLAIEEAVINAIKHGNNMDKAKRVTITYSVDRDECVISVADEGDGFSPNDVPDRFSYTTPRNCHTDQWSHRTFASIATARVSPICDVESGPPWSHTWMSR